MRTAWILAAALVPLAASAAEPLGFTPTGSVVVLLEHGVQDGTGFPWAKATFYEVRKQRALGPALEVTLDSPESTEAQAVDKVKALAEAERVRLKLEKLVPGKQIDKDEKGGLFEKAGPPIGNIEVRTRKATGKKESSQACDAPFAPLLLTLKMIWADDDQPSVLLADKTVPKERACLTGCEFDQVFALGKSALVLLKCGAPGFEGARSQVVAVPVWMKYGLDEDLPGSAPAQ